MARGWESKSVEAQMEEEAVSSATKPRRLSPQQVEAKQKRETLMLTKKKLEADLKRSSNPRHQEMLRQAIAEIDRQLQGAG